MTQPKYFRYFRYNIDEGFDYSRVHLPDVGCVFELLELEFKKTPSRGISCLQLIYTLQADKHLKVWIELEGILSVFSHYDAARFAECASAFEKKKFFLDHIRQAYMHYADQYGWDERYFDAVYQRIVAGGIMFDRPWGNTAWDRHRKVRARVHVHYDLDGAELSFVIEDVKTGDVRRKVFARWRGTNTQMLNTICGKLIWESSHRLRLYTRRSELPDYWEFDLENDRVEFHKPKAEAGDAHAQYQLGRAFLGGESGIYDLEKAVYWLRQSAAQGYKHAARLLARVENSTPR